MSSRTTRPPSLPDAQRRIAPERRPVGQGEEQDIERLVTQIPKEAIAGPARHLAGYGQVHGTEMVAHEALERAREPS
jgi:hypothetical protein